MKKKLLLFVVLLANAMGVFAAEDAGAIMSITNVKNIIPGYKGSFDIVLNNSNPEDHIFKTLAFVVELPEGFSFIDPDAKTYAKGELIPSAFPLPTISGSGQTRKFSLYSSDPAAIFTGARGVLMTIYFTVGNTATDGTAYVKGEGTQEDPKASFSLGDVTYFANDASAQLSVGNTITLDENEKETPADINSVNVKVNRHFSAGKWSTICLPFPMTAGQVTAAFGSSVKIGKFNDYAYDDNVIPEKITVNFTQVDAIEANMPYIIKVANDIESFSVTDETVNISYSATPYINFGSKLNAKNARAMVGVYELTVLDDDYLYIKDNTYKYSTGSSKLKPYHAYFWFSDFEHETVSLSRQFEINFEEETTGIINNRSKATDSYYYDLMGNAVQFPNKGIYIKEGKKVVVK